MIKRLKTLKNSDKQMAQNWNASIPVAENSYLVPSTLFMCSQLSVITIAGSSESSCFCEHLPSQAHMLLP